MRDIIEISYTGDLLSHRRCRRAWAYEKHAGFRAYEQVQAMEGRLIHHAMEWMTRQYAQSTPQQHATASELYTQLERHFRVLWARGIRTTFASRATTLERVRDNLFPNGSMHPTVRTAIEGAQHTEYELRAVRKLLPSPSSHGKSKVMLTGVLDIVVQLQSPLVFRRFWTWTDLTTLDGQMTRRVVKANPGDIEIWDYKGSRATSPYLRDYVIQLLTYAALFRERTGKLPKRCVLFFINEQQTNRQLVAVEVNEKIIEAAVQWTLQQVSTLQDSVATFESNPLALEGGQLESHTDPSVPKISAELRKQCTACGRRFDCQPYADFLQSQGQSSNSLDIDRSSVLKN